MIGPKKPEDVRHKMEHLVNSAYATEDRNIHAQAHAATEYHEATGVKPLLTPVHANETHGKARRTI
jgi:hypothetical protein